MLRCLPTLVLAVLCAGCASHDSLSAYPELQAALDEFQVEQARFAAANPVPIRFDFPGHGQVTVRDVSLDGYPGSAYVRARWHYRNTSGKPAVRALVSLDVLDAEGRMVASKVAVCIMWAPIPLADGSFYADELRTRTFDAHLQPGWSWRMTCVTQHAEPEDG